MIAASKVMPDALRGQSKAGRFIWHKMRQESGIYLSSGNPSVFRQRTLAATDINDWRFNTCEHLHDRLPLRR
jgi:hypothetical protein